MKYNLFLDDERFPSDNSTKEWIIARSYEDAEFYLLKYGMPRYISFDHDLGENKLTGMDFAKRIYRYIIESETKIDYEFDFYVHSQNPVGRENIHSYMKQMMENFNENS